MVPSVERTFETADEEVGRVVKHAETLIWREGFHTATYYPWPTYSIRIVELGKEEGLVRWPWYGSHYARQVDLVE